MALAPGSRIGPYQIHSALGAGGMGEVYRARDTTLDRDVALKILPDGFASDPERFARFEREAKTLASLNHPHIAHVYGFEQAGALSALVMELVEGEDLSRRLASGPVPVREAIAIARQMAEALEAAHERGVVHRDLKPSNIQVTPAGVVKVLDFGLAKSTPSDAGTSDLSRSPTISVGGTKEGVILGTAPYMSPEQARGRALDKRTDLWSFGCVLYEMLTGRAAFAGETVSDTIARILERDPDWTLLPPDTPHGLRTLLRRCLEKDRTRRLRDAGDARIEIDDAVAAPEQAAHRPARRQRVASIVPWLIALAALAAAVVMWRTRPSAGPQSADVRVERLTFDSGLTTSPALSRDGRLLAYASDRSGRGDLDIWVEQIGGGSTIRLTDDAADDRDPEFSPDGSQIAFRSDRRPSGIYVMPALGGTPRLFVQDGRTPRFSPDGTRLAYWTGQFRGDPSGTASETFVVPVAGGTASPVAKGFAVARDPVWAPDGNSLLILGRSNREAAITDTLDWWWAPLDGRPPVKTRALDQRDWRSAVQREVVGMGQWTAEGLLFALQGGIWSLPLSPASGAMTGPPSRLVLGAGSYRRPSASADGQVVFGDVIAHRVVERARVSPEAASEEPVSLLSDSGATARTSQTRDGAVIVFERSSGKRDEIWKKDLRNGSQEAILTVDAPALLYPTISPDGTRIGYTVPGSDRQSVTVNGRGYAADTAGGVPRPFCDDCGVYEFMSDNRRAVTTWRDTAIRLIDVIDGSSQDIVSGGSDRLERPSVSPNDRIVAFRVTVGTTAKVWIAPVPRKGDPPATRATSIQIDEPTTTGRPAGWSADSKTLYLLLDADGFRCLWAQRVDQSGQPVGKPYAARHFHDRRANNISTSLGNAISPEGFLYDTSTLSGNLWRIVRQ